MNAGNTIVVLICALVWCSCTRDEPSAPDESLPTPEVIEPSPVPPDENPVITLDLDESFETSFEADGAEHPLRRVPTELFTLELLSDASVTLGLFSTRADAFLELWNGDQIVAANDDFDGLLDSALFVPLAAGTYTIVASPTNRRS